MNAIWKTKKTLAIALGLLIGLCTTQLYAAHDEDFELDHGVNGGNIKNDGGGAPNVDWEDLYTVSGNAIPVPKTSTGAPLLPPGFGVAGFFRDFEPGKKGPDITAFTGGSADVNDIATWSCTRKNNIGNKFNILNAYATAYQNAAGETILYFALERRGNEGTASAGFWFLKDGSVACQHPSGGGSTSFTGNHEDGDTLIIADFTGGGKVSEVLAYKWVGGPGGSLVPAASGVDCADAAAGDAVCATVNQVLIPQADIPWLTETQQPGNTPSNDLDARLFMEGGINMQKAGLSGCFATYLATSRSSNSITSEKHDYVGGEFPLCSVELSKTCSSNGGYNSTTGFIEIPYTVSVKNTGVQTATGVVAVDDQCGTDLDPGVTLNFPDIAPNQTESIDGLCQLPLGTDLSSGIFNGVSATAGEGVSVTLASSCVTRTGDPGKCFAECGVNVDPAIAATKDCVTTLLAEDGVVKVNVNFDGTVSNTSDAPHCLPDNTCLAPAGDACTQDSDCESNPIPLLEVAVTDNKAGAQTLLDAPAPGGVPLATPVRLEPGEVAYFAGSYLPDGSGDGYSECPSDADFDDTVTASGTDAALGNSVEAMDTAVCKLCPPGGCPTP